MKAPRGPEGMAMRHAAWLSMVLVLGASSVALAEGPDGAPPPPPPGPPPGQMPAYQQQQPGAPPGTEQPAATGTEGRGIEYGGHLVFPVFLSLDSADGDPESSVGIGIQGRIGWEFGGGLTAELNIGGMVNTLTFDYYDPILGLDIHAEGNLSNVWFGAALRYHFFNPSAIVPFVGAGLQLNVWDLCNTDESSCASDGKDYSPVTFGLNGTAGVAYELSQQLAFELGLTFNWTTKGRVFNDPEMYVTPFLGGTLYY
jgi:opacity protein-like surface antigen